ncbi:hypothetical protein OXPF_25330 [Oxobacter pfennigii]|uniref:HEAT repeat protein n=1 Tax=Oxobacter pfennigii TaxID=36849 RepID=A0A0P8W6M8_9CLOT|nr:hypothetical protein [Oxobacter pfennigii]KPU44363.1 hypothetical protein OXPF_25330 [Oxobacter pfennigii]
MFTIESMMSIDKSGLQEASKVMDKDDISKLIELLPLKDDNIRYQAFLLLQNRSLFFDDVYPYWDNFRSKLKSDNSYQRSIGLMLIAENVKWDSENKIEDAIEEYLELLNDEKPITIRQCIQSLGKIVTYKPSLSDKIAKRLIFFNLMGVKETMRKSILLDILNALLLIRKVLKTDEIESFILKALSGEILDKKSKKQIEALL